jgi:asparagine synthase (glutamine-hydrolysing)
MCGIFGIFRQTGLRREDRWLLRGMADAIRHRGPDGEGFHLQREVGIGMRRLAIIDIETGWQPFSSEDGSIIVVANGEIYNHLELRARLVARGHVFGSASDCETILHLYEDFGADCVHHLRGMFAFAVVDNRRGKLLLARDRMGEKPLALVKGDGWLAFCSELVGLVGGGVVPIDLDPTAISLYFHYGFVPEPMTPLRSVTKLPAGSHLTVDLASGQMRQQSYWHLGDALPLNDDPVARVRSEIEDISRIISRSDRPIAVGLSAGVDSSAVAAIVSRSASQPVSAISIGYEGKQFQDESVLAGQFAKSLGLPHHRVELSIARVVDEFPAMCLHRDEPFADIAGSSIFALAAASRDIGSPVLMSGLGGDELFWGYRWHQSCVSDSLRARRARRGEASIWEYLGLSLPPVSLVGLVNWGKDLAGLRAGLRARARDLNAGEHQLVFWDAIREFREASTLLPLMGGPELRHASGVPARLFTGEQLWEQLGVSLTVLLCDTYLRSNGLVQTDRLSMACGVEARVPFVDYRLAEVVIGLRKSHPDHELPPKAWLRAALRGIVPDYVMKRRKRGFTPPWRSWAKALVRAFGEDLREGELVARGVLSSDGARYLARAIDYLGRPVPLSYASLVLEQWIRGLRAQQTVGQTAKEAEPLLPSRMIELRSAGDRS